MLRKCLKYDLASVAKVWWIAAVTVLLLALPVGLCLRDMQLHSDEYGVMETFRFSVFGVVIGQIGLGVFALLTVILIAVRFYGNFFRDEGYLTFTLPVKRQTLFLSKVVNGMIWMTACAVVSAAAVCIVTSMAPDSEKPELTVLAAAMQSVWKFLQDGYREVGAYQIVYAAELLLAVVLGVLFSILSVYLCITIGAVLAKKHKLLASIGTYYVFNIVATITIYIGIIFLAAWIFSGYAAFPEAAIGHGGIALVLLLGCVIIAVIDALLALINLGCLERKLNLA